ncbi:uncharacterized protein LOC110610970 isoform X2 [Manihot esculenta]|uniref:Dynein light chain n=1 Tax=Manihot esculenta TaxID=3983 RepID=A0A2C9W6H1_MANES|nr:uncharacterized protein LOC110610970 isoform X1 [Manihot esculenta]XP_021606744.1 uncharacterized protein LOC110610970 isoform X2 [Manihot esculenta]OAY54906.1 hypothetical protein MANES_03G111100v8 [Manihot esculenta]
MELSTICNVKRSSERRIVPREPTTATVGKSPTKDLMKLAATAIRPDEMHLSYSMELSTICNVNRSSERRIVPREPTTATVGKSPTKDLTKLAATAIRPDETHLSYSMELSTISNGKKSSESRIVAGEATTATVGKSPTKDLMKLAPTAIRPDETRLSYSMELPTTSESRIVAGEATTATVGKFPIKDLMTLAATAIRPDEKLELAKRCNVKQSSESRIVAGEATTAADGKSGTEDLMKLAATAIRPDETLLSYSLVLSTRCKEKPSSERRIFAREATTATDGKSPTEELMKLAAIAISLNVRPRSFDMPLDMQEYAFRYARSFLESTSRPNPAHLARVLKKEFDSVYGLAWHCVVGTSYGSFVTHTVGGFVYFSTERLSILLFKTEVELLPELEL